MVRTVEECPGNKVKRDVSTLLTVVLLIIFTWLQYIFPPPTKFQWNENRTGVFSQASENHLPADRKIFPNFLQKI